MSEKKPDQRAPLLWIVVLILLILLAWFIFKGLQKPESPVTIVPIATSTPTPSPPTRTPVASSTPTPSPSPTASPTETPLQKNTVTELCQPLLNDRDYIQLKNIFADKKVVFLGENGHGVSDFTETKVKIATKLIEDLDFDVILFQSGMFGPHFYPSATFQDETARTPMQKMLLQAWDQKEIAPLFALIKKKSTTKHPVFLSGIDFEDHGSFTSERAKMQEQLFDVYDHWLATTLSEGTRSWMNLKKELKSKNKDAAYRASVMTFFQFKKNYLDIFKKGESAMKKLNYYSNGSKIEPREKAFWLADFKNLQNQIEYQSLKLSKKDQAPLFLEQKISENLIELVQNTFVGHKVIVWGDNRQLGYSGDGARATLGSLWTKHPELKSQTYSLAFYMGEGSLRDSTGTVTPIKHAPPDFLEHKLMSCRYQTGITDLSRLKPDPSNAFLFSPISSFREGQFPEKLTPSQNEDGLIFIKRVSPSQLLHR